ncbi:MAG TPA: acylneuraminate cytidylyltransferase family protein [Candidatus Omnitrophota bacterium]|nr:acylneuraminate cytidylyltransferase family protein [Candidatus Omnitrophota bacterium]HPS19526.1 acylneuraminate cytidylyltransferase family protein [Candidatus Omnitrophota bacterium]
MFRGKKILAIVPARSGSKGLPNKNIKLFCGKPLICWTISEAKRSKYIDDVTVSTDSPRIAEISKKAGAIVPFLRPPELATDTASSMDVVFHAISEFEKINGRYEIVLLLQPTSPLRVSEDIDNAVELLIKQKAKAIVSLTEALVNPSWVNVLPANGCIKDFLHCSVINKRRQVLPKYFQLNGAVFLGYAKYLKGTGTFYTAKTYAYIMPRERSVDIDDIFDFKLAEIIMRERMKNKRRK